MFFELSALLYLMLGLVIAETVFTATTSPLFPRHGIRGALAYLAIIAVWPYWLWVWGDGYNGGE